MRQTISGLVAVIAVVPASAAPAMACGGGLFEGSYASPCAQTYLAPTYSACDTGCVGWPHERLPDPVQQYYLSDRVQQYYYVNQGPTYTGPGAFAPYPTYQESAVSGWDAYRRRPYHYGYDGGRYASATHHYYDGVGVEGPAIYSYRARPHFRPGVRYGYAPRRSYAPRYSLPPRQFYGPRHSMRYGAPVGMPRYYGQRERVLRRYN